MWSKISEYANEFADIVAPGDDEISDEDNDQVNRDELWTQFSNYVAPISQPTQSKEENATTKVDTSTHIKEQELYIRELERSLIQKKHENKELEKKIEELQQYTIPISSSNDIITSMNQSNALALEAKIMELEEIIETYQSEHDNKEANIENVEKLPLNGVNHIDMESLNNPPCNTSLAISEAYEIISTILQYPTDEDCDDICDGLLSRIRELTQQYNQLETSVTKFLQSNKQPHMKVLNPSDPLPARLKVIEDNFASIRNLLSQNLSEQHEKELGSILSRNLKLQQENENYRCQIEKLEKEKKNMSKEIDSLKSKQNVLELSLKDESVVEEHMKTIEDLETHLSHEMQQKYQMEASIKIYEADRNVALADLNQLKREMEALERSFVNISTENKQQKNKIEVLGNEIKKLEATARQQRVTQAEKDDDDLKRAMLKLSEKSEECEQLREALEATANRYNSSNDVLDKKLASELIVSYCESDRKHDILQLMARIMAFTDDQKHRVGITLGYDSSRQLKRSLSNQTNGRSNSNADIYVNGSNDKSFSDLWTEFLLEETKK